MKKIIGANDFIEAGCVSFETSQALKEKYNKICSYAWHISEQVKPEYNEVYGEYYPHEIKDEFPNEYDEVVETVWGLHVFTAKNSDDYGPGFFTAPLLFDVVRYFIKEHHIHVAPYWDNTVNKWSWYSELMDCPDHTGKYQSDCYYDTMEEALDMGIRVTAKDLISIC